jgi:septum site-determining protein MinC
MDAHAATPDKSSDSALELAESLPHEANVEVNASPASSDAIEVGTSSDSLSVDIESNSALTNLSGNELGLPEHRINNNFSIQLKTEAGRFLLILPTESQVPAAEFNWSEFCQQLKQRLSAGERWLKPQTMLHLISADRLLDTRQFQELSQALNNFQIQLKSVTTWRRQTAIAAVTSGYSVEQQPQELSLSSAPQTTIPPLADALYLEMTVRSGVDIRHPGTVVILGDVNPGGTVVADGDILVWGRLRGIAHAGAAGNPQCVIMALQMEPTQLRIADAIARAPEKSLVQFFPEVAHTTPQGICITRASGFSRSQLSKIEQ